MIIFHIDYDSFFASVEQQDNPKLRGEPIGITNSTRGIICTASKEAKKVGVKTGMPFFKAKKICPQLLPVPGNFQRYEEINKKSLEIFEKYTDRVEAFSIDEAFLDMTKTLKFHEGIEDAIFKIKKDIHNEFGAYITCSVGVGPNKLLAKLCSDINKPNGFFIVTDDNLKHLLDRTPLTDFCGIGRQTKLKLAEMGIESVQQLRKISDQKLRRVFGNKKTEFLKNLSLGVGETDVNFSQYKAKPKSIGHQHTLDKNTTNNKVIKANLQKLGDMVAKRLRNQKMAGRTISISLRDKDFKNYKERTTIPRHIDTSAEIYNVASKLFDSLSWKKETRLVGISISNLVPKDQTPLPLFDETQKKERIDKVLDEINSEFGDFTLVKGNTILADNVKHKGGSFLKHK